MVCFLVEYSRSDTPRSEDGAASSADEVVSCRHHTWLTIVISDYLCLQ